MYWTNSFKTSSRQKVHIEMVQDLCLKQFLVMEGDFPAVQTLYSAEGFRHTGVREPLC